MTDKTIAVQIIEAIKEEKPDTLRSIFTKNPEQITSFTSFGTQTWLGYAAQVGKLISVKTLIDIGLDVNTGDRREGRKPICSAAANAQYEIVRFLLEMGSELDVSLSVRNPLFAAIVGRSPEIVTLLLEAGIDSQVRYDSDTMKNMDAAAFALMRGEPECARLIAYKNTDGSEKMIAEYLKISDEIAEVNAFS